MRGTFLPVLASLLAHNITVVRAGVAFLPCSRAVLARVTPARRRNNPRAAPGAARGARSTDMIANSHCQMPSNMLETYLYLAKFAPKGSNLGMREV
jgi:hypothetical protein